ncbi:MAG: DEAD/DEAH box helicase [Archaeoglobaceae archaeon]|nr:DEAD/DEAH box helicase [Archaeoglobaceae archaeon]MDW7989439.1 DEAD/DEAH box helicase [Archaeoglobaceae archaeon]
MKVEELSDRISTYAVEILKESGIMELFPPQVESLPFIFERKNLILAIPTAAGKTLVAEIAMIIEILRGGKCLYITPLRALANEKFENFRKWEKIGVQIGIATGDYESVEAHLANSDIVVTTAEKADSLLRNRAFWLREITCVVVDEIHMLDSEDRGHTLEVFITKMRKMKPDIWIIGLSATAPNVSEIAEWLNAKFVQSSWRPVPLYYGVLCENSLEIFGERDIKKNVNFETLVEDCIANKGGVLIFESTRKNAESLALKLSEISRYHCECRDLAEEILEENDGEMSRKLASCVEKGSAFHHAGLLIGQRKVVEKAFRDGRIKIIVATPTLAAGVNLPARRVIVKSLYRYDGYSRKIKVSEFKQMAGRAGRPGMDTFGEAIVVVSKKDKDIAIEKYINGEPEKIISKLAVETKLRFHCLSLICDGLSNLEDLIDFFNATLFAKQSDFSKFEIERVLRQLENWEMIRINDKIIPTKLGSLVSRLYIDPMTGFIFYDSLKNFDDLDELAILHLICRTPDMEKLNLKKDDEWIEDLAFRFREKLTYFPSQFSVDYEWFLTEFKTALCLYEWINEVDENRICDTFSIAPGDLRRICETAEWIAHALSRIANDFGKNFQNIETRIRYGVKEELLELVSIRNIGRVRARRLFNAGIKKKEEIVANAAKVIKLLGEKTAEKVLKDINTLES